MADLRHIQIPTSVSITINKAQWSFLHCLTHVVDGHPSFNQTGTGVRAAARIMGLIVDKEGKFLKKEGDVLTLDQADWQMVHVAFETPSSGYVPGPLTDDNGRLLCVPARSFVTYIEAVSDEATKALPKAKTNGVVESAAPQAEALAAAEQS